MWKNKWGVGVKIVYSYSVSSLGLVAVGEWKTQPPRGSPSSGKLRLSLNIKTIIAGRLTYRRSRTHRPKLQVFEGLWDIWAVLKYIPSNLGWISTGLGYRLLSLALAAPFVSVTLNSCPSIAMSQNHICFLRPLCKGQKLCMSRSFMYRIYLKSGIFQRENDIKFVSWFLWLSNVQNRVFIILWEWVRSSYNTRKSIFFSSIGDVVSNA